MRIFTETGEAGGNSSPARECYRCDRNVAPQFLFEIEIAPPDVLSEKYADSVRYCCEHCAAGMNLSDFSAAMKPHSPSE